MVCLVCSWQTGIEESTKGPRRPETQMQTHFTDNLDRETQYAEMGWWHREFNLDFLHLACVSFDCCYAQAFLCICLFFPLVGCNSMPPEASISMHWCPLEKPKSSPRWQSWKFYFGITKALEKQKILSHVVLVTQPKMHISPSNVKSSNSHC